MSIISRQFAGITLLIVVVTTLVGVLFFNVPLLAGLGMVFFGILFIFFLQRPAVGLLLILFTRVLIDQIANSYNISITENITLNIAALFGILVIGNAIIYIFVTHARPLKKLPLLFPFLLLIVILGYSIFDSINALLSLQESLRILSIFSIFLVSYDLVRYSILKIDHLISVILLSAVIPFVIAVYQIISDTGLSGTTGIDGRLYGTFSHPNAFAAYVLIIFALLIYGVLSEKGEFTVNHLWKNKMFLSILATVTLLILLLTFSRGGWMALLIFMTLIGIFRAPKVLILTVVMIFGFFFLSDTVHDRIENIYNPPADSSIRWRFEQWQDVIEAWKLDPITGYGAGTEVLIHEQEQGFYAGNPYTHNDFLKVLQENGIIGFIGYLILIVSTLVALTRAYLRAPKEFKFYILVIAFLFISEVAFGMSSNIWRGTAVQWILWSLIASALAVSTLSRQHLPSKEVY